MKLLTIVGARPQFVKAAVVSRAIGRFDSLCEAIVHTGQHFDSNMSDIFFNELEIPRPTHILDINGGSHGEMTGRMLIEIERLILAERPDRILVYGDTNSTLAGALAAAKLHVPVAHVEAGLRSFNMKMPEEINRIVTDQVSDLLFCPTQTAVDNLAQEGFAHRQTRIANVGDVMQDAALLFRQKAYRPAAVDEARSFILATIHRAENTDDPSKLTAIVEAVNELHANVARVVLPIHPRTRKVIASLGLDLAATVIDPVGYLEMLWLLDKAGLVLTDSGGVQKEAYFFGKPCVTMREQTEWVELLTAGANVLTGANRAAIVAAAGQAFGRRIADSAELYGGGEASVRIASILAEAA